MNSTNIYPQPPFKKFVRIVDGQVLEVGNNASFLNNEGRWELEHKEYIKKNKTLYVNNRCDLIVATADSKEELK